MVSNFMASQDARLSKVEADFKQQQGEITNKIDTFLKAINDRMTRALPSDTVKNLKLNINSTSLVLDNDHDTIVKVEEESEESVEEEEDDPEYFDTFPTVEELEDTTIDHYLREMVLGKPFVKETGLVYNKEERTVMFEKEGNDDDHEKTHYSDNLNLGPAYRRYESVTKAIQCLIKMKSRTDRGGVTLHLMRKSPGFLRSFMWTVLG
ncbi:hypothetical protein Tco_0336843 [Tanacetum coccineum]